MKRDELDWLYDAMKEKEERAAAKYDWYEDWRKAALEPKEAE